MVFIDIPLDVAMARRLLRQECLIESIKESLSSYLRGGRTIYLHFEHHIKEKSDLILDGCLPVDDLADAIYARLIQKP
jgi:thymidylate kinase